MIKKIYLEYKKRLIIILLLTIISRILFTITSEIFYDYISYLFSIGFLILLLLPNLDQFKFWGIEARNKTEDNTNDIIWG